MESSPLGPNLVVPLSAAVVFDDVWAERLTGLHWGCLGLPPWYRFVCRPRRR
jgi:hypothetical protein